MYFIFPHLEGISTLNVAYTPQLASEYIQLHLYLHLNMVVTIVGFYIWIATSTLHRVIIEQ